MWLDALEMLLQKLNTLCDLSNVTAISGAGQQHGSVYLNEKWFHICKNLDPNRKLSKQVAPSLSREFSPIWMDKSTTLECQEITQSIGGNSEICSKIRLCRY